MESGYILEMINISKSFPGVRALKNVNFKVKKGEVHCLIGANGAGKSTLMKILAGAYTEDEGEIYFDGQRLKVSNTLARKKAGISVIYQELSLVNDLNVTENIYLNNYLKKRNIIDWNSMYKNAEKMVKELNLNIDVKSEINQLSIGQRQLVELMKALACDAKLIVMDEPSATLSRDEFETLIKVINTLKQKSITIIYISHRLEELFIVGDNITVMRDGEHVGTLATSEINVDTLVEYMIGYTIKKQTNTDSKRNFSNENIIEIQGISNKKLNNVSLSIRKGEILGMYGLVGSGRTEILRSIYGVDAYSEGKILYKNKEVKFKSPIDAIRNGIGLLPENRKTQGLVLSLPVWENSSMVAIKKFIRYGVIQFGNLKKSCDGYVQNLKIKTPSVNTMTQNLSGGNQQKVIISKWLMQDCEVLLIDEPTQGIDVGTKSEIYKIIRDLADSGKSILIASSELEELLEVCDSIVVLYEGKVIKQFSKDNVSEDAILQIAVSGREL